MSNTNSISPPPPPFRRRLNPTQNLNIPFQDSWKGFFTSKEMESTFQPTKIWDPNHICTSWKKCCSENFYLAPTHLLKLEEKKGSLQNKQKIKFLEKELNIIKNYIIKHLNNDFKNENQVKQLMAIMKTYTWLCSELIRVKF